jgi:hypothetical protein
MTKDLLTHEQVTAVKNISELNLKEMSLLELKSLHEVLLQEIKTRAKTVRAFVEVMGWKDYESKNMPFLGVVTDWPVAGSPKLSFGRYIGSRSGGELEVEARPGDLVMYGQNFEVRFKKRSFRTWAIVQDDGSLERVSPSEARRTWTEMHSEVA